MTIAGSCPLAPGGPPAEGRLPPAPGLGRISELSVDCEPGRKWHGHLARGSEKSPDMGKMPMPHRTTDNSEMRPPASSVMAVVA